jgi:hypothetical protein
VTLDAKKKVVVPTCNYPAIYHSANLVPEISKIQYSKSMLLIDSQTAVELRYATLRTSRTRVPFSKNKKIGAENVPNYLLRKRFSLDIISCVIALCAISLIANSPNLG